MDDAFDRDATVSALGMVALHSLVTDYNSRTKETNLDIVLVVDVSGSMEGVPLKTMKRVCLHLINLLKEDHRLGIVTYETNVHLDLELTICTEQNKGTAKHIVENFSARGATKFYEGVLTGLQMAYRGGRRSRVLLFTDGYPNGGRWEDSGDIIREIVRETTALASRTQAQVTLSTFGYADAHNEYLLQQLATNVGGGTYNFVNEDTRLGKAVGHVLSDAINTVAENIKLTLTPLNGVHVVEAITNFTAVSSSGKWTFEIPSMADQQSKHILLRLAVPPAKEENVYMGLYHVTLTYTNTLTAGDENGEDYLFVERTKQFDKGIRSRDVDAQLNRVYVVGQIQEALIKLNSNDRVGAVEYLRKAHQKIQNSNSKKYTLSVCLCEDLKKLMQEVERGDLAAQKSLQDSLTGHWQEKGGISSCYVTRKEDKLISKLN